MGNVVKLVLGVTEAPYKSGKTTGEVAEALEKKYHLMQTFSELYGSNIGAMLEEGVAAALNSMLNGGPVNKHPFESGCAKIENLFRQSLTIKAYDGLIPGTPTQAALKGVSHRFVNVYNTEYYTAIDKKTGKVIRRKANKKQRAARMQRPSFVDTGTFSKNFAASVETE
jgi:hypothetical protein